LKPSIFSPSETNQSPNSSDPNFSLHTFGTHLASSVTSPVTDFTQIKPNTEAGRTLFSCLPLPFYQLLCKTVFKVMGSLGFSSKEKEPQIKSCFIALV